MFQPAARPYLTRLARHFRLNKDMDVMSMPDSKQSKLQLILDLHNMELGRKNVNTGQFVIGIESARNSFDVTTRSFQLGPGYRHSIKIQPM